MYTQTVIKLINERFPNSSVRVLCTMECLKYITDPLKATYPVRPQQLPVTEFGCIMRHNYTFCRGLSLYLRRLSTCDFTVLTHHCSTNVKQADPSHTV